MAERIRKDNFEEKVLQSEVPLLVDFYSDSCVPCKQISPLIGELEDDYEGKLAVYKVNVNFEEELTSEYSVLGVPTLLVFRNGETKGKKTGIISRNDLREWISGYVE